MTLAKNWREVMVYTCWTQGHLNWHPTSKTLFWQYWNWRSKLIELQHQVVKYTLLLITSFSLYIRCSFTYPFFLIWVNHFDSLWTHISLLTWVSFFFLLSSSLLSIFWALIEALCVPLFSASSYSFFAPTPPLHYFKLWAHSPFWKPPW